LAVISSVAVAAAATFPAIAQAPGLPSGAGGSAPPAVASITDFAGAIWAHPMFGFELALSVPGPVVNTKRTAKLTNL
jgi:hypothetical protein